MKAVCGGLLFLMSAMWLVSCSVFAGTPMLGHENCRYMPTVEECQSAAHSHITDPCLLGCVIDQCRNGLNLCGAGVVATCSALRLNHPESETGGYVQGFQGNTVARHT
jgi:hypothetical protein